MPTLLMRLAGPLQSWGTSSHFNNRGTAREPSKSGVIGMVAAAMGRSRDDSVDDLASLRYGVRVDQEGPILRDFHTARHPTNQKLAFVTNRYYLSDSVFIAGLEGDAALLEEADMALRSPQYPLFLGRRSCPPAGRVSLGIREMSLEKALESEPWCASEWYMRRQGKEVDLEIVTDSPEGGDSEEIVRDVPESFSQERREFSVRSVSRKISGKHVENALGREYADHDAMAEVARSGRCTYQEWN
ncbi:type I-E CRISPR-associated protein Cas5/CasD [Methanomassiliicoccales archaeon LGM-DZ1]|nr:type I-E CRISPR-associated protein Cas5/CasD [Methanomassiliicoccales archaeon LGM-DZ1]